MLSEGSDPANPPKQTFELNYKTTHLQEPCEWFAHDLEVLLVKLEQILHLEVECSDFGPVRDGQFTLVFSLQPNFVPCHELGKFGTILCQARVRKVVRFSISLTFKILFCKSSDHIL